MDPSSIQPWFLKFARSVRCQEHRVRYFGNLSVVVVNPVGYVASASCAGGEEQLVMVGLKAPRPLRPIELSDQALAVWQRVAPELSCPTCHKILPRDFVIAVQGEKLRHGAVVSQCQECQGRFGLPIFWTYHVGPVDDDEFFRAREKLKLVHTLDELLN